MTSSATEFETDLVDLSQCGLQEVMTFHDPLVVDALHTLVRYLGEGPAAQSANGGGGSPYFAAGCDSGDA
ncbi:hypothetical protein AB0I98_28490 [Streptomyces sp. NPDC050211]|uniref:hypothetical protein n=1 Tax=Streptomyces sp. NPDC050211 TaxID=3154932 RepID=UPI003420E864